MFARKVPDEKKANNSVKYKQLSLLDLFAEYGDSYIVENSIAQEEKTLYVKTHTEQKQITLNTLRAKQQRFTIQVNDFPATVALNKLYYFMPYLIR